MDRQSHAALEPKHRELKAVKIERLLDLPTDWPRPLRLLDVGAGSGVIARHFASSGEDEYIVDAVDLRDSRVVKDGYRFQLVNGTELPFEDGAFDVVVSNHVVEHVGDRGDQLRHLEEIRRVLRPQGRAYVAVPNRWMIVEPHYRLAFLSWLPHGCRSAYLRLRRRGHEYDCEPFELDELESSLAQAGLAFENLCIPSVREMFKLEPPQGLLPRLAFSLPDHWLWRLRRIVPTLIYKVTRQ